MRPAPAARAALDELTRIFPTRSRISDGIVGDAAHQARPSFHNAYNLTNHPALFYGRVEAAVGFCLAIDITHDVANGVDAHAIARRMIADPRVVEVITEGKIWTRRRASEGFRTYTGANKHFRHSHISIAPSAWDSRESWFSWLTPAAPTPAPVVETPKPAPAPTPAPAAPAAVTKPVAAPIAAPVTKPAAAPAKPALPLLSVADVQPGSRNKAAVMLLQSALNRVGTAATRLKVDGDFGAKTLAAYAAWQRSLGFTGAAADGKPGFQSLSQLALRSHMFKAAT
jgi:peptidoglycan hydrolase-like protein with peptidoglycan-binding domain